jgi:hypothetical protein
VGFEALPRDGEEHQPYWLVLNEHPRSGRVDRPRRSLPPAPGRRQPGRPAPHPPGRCPEFAGARDLEVERSDPLARAIEAGPYDLVITDYGLGFTDGYTLLESLKSQWPECPVILCTGTLSEEIAVEALRRVSTTTC